MNNPIDRLNEIFEKHKDSCDGSFHNCLWQIMVNDSLEGQEACFVQQATEQTVSIALGSGGFITSMFATTDEAVIDDLNIEVFGLQKIGVWDCICRSLRNTK
jgi:hypothetical protein